MIGRATRPLAAALIAVGLAALAAPPASAHERRGLGDLEMVVGFGVEPAYAGQPNSVQVRLTHDGGPVVDLGDTLDVEVSFGEETMTVELEPHFAVGAFGDPGDYRAWFIPTRPGRYTFHVFGTVDGEDVDETFTSGPNTFGDVNDPADLSFPAQDPTTGELANLIERLEPRLSGGIEDASGDAELALAEANRAGDDVAGARTFGVIGIGVGALGLVVAVVALATTRRRAT